MTIRERIRWAVATRLDRSARTCWADLCTWAMEGSNYGPTLLELLRRGDAREGSCKPNCWCGKNKTPEQRALDEAKWADDTPEPDVLPF